jgi:hypothetical protein
MRSSTRIMIIGLCAIMLYAASACDQSQKQLLAHYRAQEIADDLDRKLYFGLHQKEVVRGTVEQHLENLYINDCNLR